MKERVFKKEDVIRRTSDPYQIENYLSAGYEEVTEDEKIPSPKAKKSKE
ncbi:hypothetical protein NHG32_02375 [Aerococcaceae bacterium NML191219]|nr:hypothetical protein [Aerococcaceae bacterium NML191219]